MDGWSNPKYTHTQSYSLDDLTKQSEKYNIAGQLSSLQTASLGNLACGMQTEEQLGQSDEIIVSLENDGYPSDAYMRTLARHAFGLSEDDLLSLAGKIYDERKNLLLAPYRYTTRYHKSRLIV